MHQFLINNDLFGNAASRHTYGKKAKDAIETARCQVASLIHAAPEEIIWTSGATESNNLAIKGAARLYQRKGKHLITLTTEHKSVLDAMQHLEKEGYQVTYLNPRKNGLLDLDQLKEAIRPDTILMSIMHVNNETGLIQDIASIAPLTHDRGILLHVDAVQSAGKIEIDVSKTPIDMLSVTAHKVYGPKGIAALYLRKKPRVRVEPLIHGGGHEQGQRSGTLPTHQIVGMGEAFHIAKTCLPTHYPKMSQLRERFLTLLKSIPKIQPNVDPTHCVPHILNLRFEGMLADAVLDQLPTIAASTASACLGKGTEGSYVLRAMGLTTDQIKSSIRFSLGRMTTEEELMKACEAMRLLFQTRQ